MQDQDTTVSTSNQTQSDIAKHTGISTEEIDRLLAENPEDLEQFDTIERA